MVRFSCPSCNRTLQAPESRAGAVAVCPGCKQQLQIPAPPPPEPEPIPYAEIREAPPPMPRPAPQPVPPRGGRAEYDEPPADPDREPSLRRRPPGRSGNWAWRWCSPSVLVLGLLMLPLPFLEVQCSAPGQVMNMALVNQSGVQMMTGRYSIDSSIDRFNKQMAGFGVPVNAGQVPWAPGGPQQLNVKAAPLMIAVPFLLLAGIAVGLALRPTALRVPLVAGAIVAALVLVFVQMAVGFPLEREVRDSIDREMRRVEDQMKALGGGPPGGNPFGGPGGGNPFGPKMGINPFGGPGGGLNQLAGAMVQTHYTPWFWLWLVLLVGSLGPLVGEMIWSLTHRPRRRWRPAYADDY
jgi:hypothetical protein